MDFKDRVTSRMKALNLSATDISKLTGVSKATVSRVLSGNGYTSQETRARVQQAIEECGYRPNLEAR